MKKRERLDAELEEVHRQLARMSTGASVLQPSRRASSIDPEDESPDDAEKRIVAPGRLTTAAFQLAGYVVATLALGRSIPGTIALGANAEYDVGRCSETDLHAIWAVGDLAAERARGDGCPWEPGPSIVIFKNHGASAGATLEHSRWKAIAAMHSATTGRSQPVRRIESKPPNAFSMKAGTISCAWRGCWPTGDRCREPKLKPKSKPKYSG